MVKKYFLGSFSPEGFKSGFGKTIENADYKTVILKGGAGTGKSSLMKKISKEFSKNYQVEEYYCSSDPDSLDAVVLKNQKKIIVDGTAPHVFDPSFPGVKERILNLGDFWDEKMLSAHKQEIITTACEHKKLMERTQRYVRALSSIYNDTYTVAKEAVLSDKLEAFIDRLIKKLAVKKLAGDGKISTLQLSALTPRGYVTHESTLDDMEIYTLYDNYFAGSDKLLKTLCDIFTDKGYDVEISFCNLFSFPVYEHIIVPQLKLAFVCSNPLTDFYSEKEKHINLSRFYDSAVLQEKKARLKLNKKACADLLNEAQRTMQTALKVHNELEKYYISAMDFDAVSDCTNELIREFNS